MAKALTMKKNEMRLKISILIVSFFILGSTNVLAHGGKKHGDEEFSNFQAVQKATKLYDQLIKKGKLPEVWETGLQTIDVQKRRSSGKLEYVVQFNRVEGTPTSVYFFFDQKGKYSGSNFTGK